MICQIVSSYLKMWQYFQEVILVVNTQTHWINIYEWIHIRYNGGICILPSDYWSWKSLALLCMKSISVRPQDVPPCTCISNIFDCNVNTTHPSFRSEVATQMQANKYKSVSLYKHTSSQCQLHAGDIWRRCTSLNYSIFLTSLLTKQQINKMSYVIP